jgi:localization factor PodJL
VARGLGPTADLVEAYKWFALAAAQGDEDAGAKRDEVAQRLDAAALAKAKTAVASFTPKDSPVTANDSTLPAVSWGDRAQSGA